MKKLIVLSGIPGSGKSTWAKQYQKENENVIILSSDELRFEITGERQNFSKQKEVWETFSKRIHTFAKENDNLILILDALNDLNSLRQKYVLDNPEYNEYELVYFDIKPKLAIERNSARGIDTIVPDDAMEALMAKFEKPDEKTLKLFNKVTIIK